MIISIILQFSERASVSQRVQSIRRSLPRFEEVARSESSQQSLPAVGEGVSGRYSEQARRQVGISQAQIEGNHRHVEASVNLVADN